MDETLVHYDYDSRTLRVRPFADQFIDAMAKVGYEVVIFTAGKKDYANRTLDKLGCNPKSISRRFFRDDC